MKQVLYMSAEKCTTKKGGHMTINTPDSIDVKTWSAESELGGALFGSDLGIDALQSQLSPVSVIKFLTSSRNLARGAKLLLVSR